MQCYGTVKILHESTMYFLSFYGGCYQNFQTPAITEFILSFSGILPHGQTMDMVACIRRFAHPFHGFLELER